MLWDALQWQSLSLVFLGFPEPGSCALVCLMILLISDPPLTHQHWPHWCKAVADAVAQLCPYSHPQAKLFELTAPYATSSLFLLKYFFPTWAGNTFLSVFSLSLFAHSHTSLLGIFICSPSPNLLSRQLKRFPPDFKMTFRKSPLSHLRNQMS